MVCILIDINSSAMLINKKKIIQMKEKQVKKKKKKMTVWFGPNELSYGQLVLENNLFFSSLTLVYFVAYTVGFYS